MARLVLYTFGVLQQPRDHEQIKGFHDRNPFVYTSAEPKYTENIALYLVGSDPSQTVDLLEKDRQKQGYPWPVAGIGSSGLRNLHVLQQSTKIAIDGDGVITYRDGYGRGDLDKWRNALEDLTANRTSS